MELKLNGIRTYRVGSTIFIPLPRELWRDAHGCCCKYCSPKVRESRPAYWDTLAVSADRNGAHRTWTVHAPEYHGVKPLRGEAEEYFNPDRSDEDNRSDT